MNLRVSIRGWQTSSGWPVRPNRQRRLQFSSSDPAGLYDQQHDSANQRDQSRDGRYKVVVGGGNVHSEELDGFSRRREAQAGIGEHHDSKDDQTNGSYGFYVHKGFYFVFFAGRPLNRSAAGDEVDQDHDDRNDQQDVNESAHRVTGYETEQPQNEQYYCNCV